MLTQLCKLVECSDDLRNSLSWMDGVLQTVNCPGFVGIGVLASLGTAVTYFYAHKTQNNNPGGETPSSEDDFVHLEFSNEEERMQEDEIKKSQEKINKLQEALNDSEKKFDQQWEKCQKELEKFQEKLQTLQEICEQKTEENSKLSRELSQGKEELERLKQQLLEKEMIYKEQLQFRIDALNQNQKKINRLEEQIQKLQVKKPAAQNSVKEEKREETLQEKRENYLKTCWEKLKTVRNQVGELEEMVSVFRGKFGGADFVHINEMLIRSLITVDRVESKGNEGIRSEKKELKQLILQRQEDLKNKCK